MVYIRLIVAVIGQFSHDVISCWDSSQWLVRFDPCIVVQSIEEQALATYEQTVPLWLRYVDDTFTAVHKDEIDTFHEHLNRQNADIQFTREVEENGKIPFLNCLVSRHDNKLQTTIYRKPTHTDRLLDQSNDSL